MYGRWLGDSIPAKGRAIIFLIVGGGVNFGKKNACRLGDSKVNCLHKHLCEKIVCRKKRNKEKV